MKVSTCSFRPILQPCSLEGLNYQIDTYVGCEHYCYYCYALNSAETDWSEEILTHRDIIGQLSQELENIPPQTVYFGYKTDPYQPIEAKLFQTRQVLELLLERGFSVSILTKSNLVERDIDLLKEMPDAAVGVSVAYNHESTHKLFEAKTMDTRLRINALQKLKKAGISTYALLCPVIPLITDVKALLEKLVPCTNKIWIYGLSFLSPTEQNWLNTRDILKLHFPELFEEIKAIVFSKTHSYWTELRSELGHLQNEKQLNLSIHV